MFSFAGNIQLEPNLPAGSNFIYGVSYTDYESLVINPATKTIYSFTLDGGWKPLATLPVQLIDPAVTLVPKGLFRCI